MKTATPFQITAMDIIDGNVVAIPKELKDPWPEPEPLIGASEATPYPVDALPEDIGAAVEEVNAFTQSPAAMAACSAISALSLAAQGLASVQRAEDALVSPVSIYTLVLADSGERKTTLDAYFTAPIREFEREAFERAKPEMAEFRADEKAWAARVKGIEARIVAAAKNGKPTAQLEQDLQSLELSKPIRPRVARLLYNDATPEALSWKLAELYPSAGVFASEGGTVLGGHGMNRDSSMRNFAFYNTAWDGRKDPTDRRSQDSTRACPVRLTVAIAVQPETVRRFLESTRGLAKEIGWLPRFLIAWPESTRGTRKWKEPPKGWPALTVYRQRLRELLQTPLEFDDETGDLVLPVLDFSPETKLVWIELYNEIEGQVSPSGPLSSVHEFAAKVADNGARLAALFHLYANGPAGKIGAESMRAARRIVTWHAREALRFIGGLALPRATANALALDKWLVDRCKAQRAQSIGRREIRQYGPGAIRDSGALDAALDNLAEAGHIRESHDGKKLVVEINPLLLGGSQ